MLEIFGAADAPAREVIVSHLYRAIFSQPPFSVGERGVAGQRALYAEISGRAGFRLCLARIGGQYVGFAYGHLLSASSEWWAKVNRPLSAAFTAETGTRTFAVDDLGVLPGHRRLGIGRAVHDALLGASDAERATLCVRRTADAARAAYRQWNWRAVGPMTAPPGAAQPVFDVLVRRLRLE